jgi:hypothetical protein
MTSLSQSQSLFCPALVSSIIETSITHPIDVIKIHKQTSQPIAYNFKTLYSGYIPRALGNIPSRTLFLFSQDYLHYYFNKSNSNTYDNSCCRKNYQVSKNIQSIIIPVLAGFSQTLVDTPVENIKMNQVMKMKNKDLYKYKELYKGFVPHFFRNFIFVMCVYNFKQLGISNGMSNGNSNFSGNSYISPAIYSSICGSIYGSFGGLVGSYISHPLDTIKTCIQTNRTFDNFTIKDYMRGCHLRAGMGMINMFVSLYVFEIMKRW